jgi:hypothetical protein
MTSTPTEPTQFDGNGLKPSPPGWWATWFWPLLWLTLLVSSSTVGLWALIWLTRIPPLPNCDQISSFSADGDRLYCAGVTADAGQEADLLAAIALVTDWQPDHPLYDESQKFVDRWSRALFTLAQQHLQQGALSQAIELVQQIPERADTYGEGQQAIATWQEEWTRGEAIAQQVDQSVNNQNWSGARKALQEMKLLSNDYWLATRYQVLADRVSGEERARSQLLQARTLAAAGDIEAIGEALTLALALDVKSQAWPEAKLDINVWAQILLRDGFQKWEAEDIDGAIAVIQKVPVDLAQEPEAQDLVRFAHAQRLARAGQGHWLPGYGEIWNLLEAIRAVQAIPATSPFYQAAQVSQKQWIETVDDLRQLQFANLLAQLGLKPAYREAIAQAAQIGPERPQRLRAQTLVSHWHQEIERLEDRPYLMQAEKLATAGKIPGLKAAIQAASRVKLGRALRVEAQTKIAAWTQQIQTIEDQPILDKALALANQGKLKEAIEQARNIKAGRALYETAQTSVADWTAQIQIAEDRPILARAENLAARGRLSDAIYLASRIGPGRALYREARSSIAIWDKERQYIWAIRGRPAAAGAAADSSDTDQEP